VLESLKSDDAVAYRLATEAHRIWIIDPLDGTRELSELAAVALAAGLHVSRLDDSPLRFNQPEPSLPDVLICRRDLAAPIPAALGVANGFRLGGAP
jgi:3'-phosphoadenosine 5'-phosphosulfate (PAPS) 3'-phosphatase